MYAGTEALTQAIEQSSRRVKARVKINDDWNTQIKSLKITTSAGNNDINIGMAISSCVEITLLDTERVYEGAELEIQIGVVLPDNTTEYVPMGFHFAQKPEESGGVVKFTAYDRMSRLETPYISKLAYPATVKSVLEEIGEQCGIDVDVTDVDDITVSEMPDGYTCREIAGYMAGLCGKFAVFDRFGKLTLKWYESVDYTAKVSRTFKYIKNQTDYELGYITCNIDKATSITSGTGSRGITFDNPFMTQERLDAIFDKIGGFTYRPGAVNVHGDIRLDVGDIINTADLNKNYVMPIMQLVQTYNGGINTDIEAYGKTEAESTADFKGPTTKALERTYVELLLVNEVVGKKISAEEADVRYLKVEKETVIQSNIYNAVIEQADIRYTKMESFDALSGRVGTLEAQALKADSAEIKDLITRVNRTDTLIFGSASGNTIQTEFSNSVIAQLGNAQIKSAMIDEIDAAKITGLDINTSKLTVHSADGKSQWVDNTIVISDGTRTRVQIGKDASADYNMYIWDKSGNLMLDALGLTAEGITRQIIRDDVIMDNADISASKLNIESLFNVINTDGSHTLKSSKIYVDADGQTLDIAFKNMTTSVSAVTSTATTALSTANSAATKIDDLEIGGRNLVKNSAKRNFAVSTNGGAYTNKLVADTEALSGYHSEVTCTTSGTGFFSHPYICETGKTYTYSFWAKSSVIKSGGTIGFENGGMMSIKLDTEWQYYTHTFTATERSWNAFICYPYFAVGEVFYIRDFKLEYGSKATTWTPAPEDTDSAITAVDDRVTTVMQTVTTQGTQISTLQGQITSKIWQQDITSAVDDISVGNRNLIARTAAPFTITGTSYYSYISKTFTVGELTTGENYAVSFDVEVLTGTVDKISVAVYNSDTTVGYGMINASIIDGKVTGIITPSGAATKLLIYAGKAGATLNNSIKVSNLMFCKGNKIPSDWTPAPEDTDSAVYQQQLQAIQHRLQAIAVMLHRCKVQ